MRGNQCDETAGHLLSDAIALFIQGRLSSAAVLADFCREELGRANILSALRKHARASGSIAENLLKTECDKHFEKLRLGQAAVVGAKTGWAGFSQMAIVSRLESGAMLCFL
ncbi:MAG: AbiV family abortive infection protein [Candidatus Acidiferrales bacterium]